VSPAQQTRHILYFYQTGILPVVRQHSVGQYEPTFLVSLDVVGPLEQPSLHVLVVLHRWRRTPFDGVGHPVSGAHGRRTTVSRGFPAVVFFSRHVPSVLAIRSTSQRPIGSVRVSRCLRRTGDAQTK